jgi:hypothetical protein
MGKEIFITTVTKEDYDSFTEREKSIYNKGLEDGMNGRVILVLMALSLAGGVLIGILICDILNLH